MLRAGWQQILTKCGTLLLIVMMSIWVGCDQPLEAGSSIIPEPAAVGGVGLSVSGFSAINALQRPGAATPVAMTPPEARFSVINVPQRPGAPSTYTFRFRTTNRLEVGQEITLLFAKEFQVPSTIDRNQVSLTANNLVFATDDVFPSVCAVGSLVAPSEVAIEFVMEDNAQPEVRLRVPDMNPSSECEGNYHISAGSEVTVIFRQAAGIRNPFEGHPGRRVEISTTSDPTPLAAFLPVPWTVELSHSDRSRGEALTVTGYGFRGQTTFWRDANADGLRQAAEAGPTGLCTTVADSQFVAICTFTVSNPPFNPGFYDGAVAGATCTVDPSGNLRTGRTTNLTTACNYINANDSRGSVVQLDLFNSPQIRLNESRLDLLGSVRVVPSTGRSGDTVTVSLRDFPAFQALTQLEIGGIPVVRPSPGSITTGANGAANFSMIIPSGVPPGPQVFQVRSATPVDSTILRANFFISVEATLSLSHQQVVPNQNLTISGSGFTRGVNVCIEDGGIMLADIPLKIADVDSCPNFTYVTHGVRLSSEGTFTLTVRIHDLNNTIPVALTTPGTHELRVRDNAGTQGRVMVTIPARTLEVSPPSAPPGTMVTIIGRHFISNNPGSPITSRVDITYNCTGVGLPASVSSEPDVAGNLREVLHIPTLCAIPSTNSIMALVGGAGISASTTHQIPNATVQVRQAIQDPSGTQVQVIGEGFRPNETIAAIELGGREVLGSSTVTIGADGVFEFTETVLPWLNTGTYPLVVRVGSGAQEIIASTNFFVSSPPPITPTPIPPTPTAVPPTPTPTPTPTAVPPMPTPTPLPPPEGFGSNGTSMPTIIFGLTVSLIGLSGLMFSLKATINEGARWAIKLAAKITGRRERGEEEDYILRFSLKWSWSQTIFSTLWGLLLAGGTWIVIKKTVMSLPSLEFSLQFLVPFAVVSLLVTAFSAFIRSIRLRLIQML